MVVRFDSSYPVFSHLSKRTGERSWRLDDIHLKEKVQEAWQSTGGGYCDVKGIVDGPTSDIGSGVKYLRPLWTEIAYLIM